MDCSELRAQLTDARAPAGEIAEHLAACAACARFAERLSLARELLSADRADARPDAHFAERVRARLVVEPAADLGWAALRVLPATLALLLILAWLSFQATSRVEASVETSPTEDLLTWTLELAGGDS